MLTGGLSPLQFVHRAQGHELDDAAVGFVGPGGVLGEVPAKGGDFFAGLAIHFGLQKEDNPRLAVAMIVRVARTIEHLLENVRGDRRRIESVLPAVGCAFDFHVVGPQPGDSLVNVDRAPFGRERDDPPAEFVELGL